MTEAATTLEQRTQAVLAMLRAGNVVGSRVDVFDGEPDAVMDGDRRAHPYAALYTSPGWHDPTQESLDAATPGHLVWTFQVTAAGGDATRARRAVDRVLDRLLHRRLVVAGIEQGVIRVATDPGAIQIDRDVQPSRSYVPLLFTVEL
jgi:hypothetical protein